jgi:hypothetical protein
MNSGRMHVGFMAGIALSLSVFAVTPAWPGGELGADRDRQQEGLAIFGFVKDSSGRAVRDAKVTANIKGLGSVITKTDATGVYKFPGLGKGIKQEQVSVACSKDGYKQTRTLTRTPPAKAPLVAVEIGCTMQRLGAK